MLTNSSSGEETTESGNEPAASDGVEAPASVNVSSGISTLGASALGAEEAANGASTSL